MESESWTIVELRKRTAESAERVRKLLEMRADVAVVIVEMDNLETRMRVLRMRLRPN